MFNYKKYSILIILTTLIFSNLFSKILIWDLGNTLVETNNFKIASEVGLGGFIFHALIDWRNPANIKDDIFNLLNAIKKHPKSRKYIPVHNGKKLPELMCLWLEGKITGAEIYNQVNRFIKRHKTHDLFVSSRHEKLIRNSIKTIFDPEKLTKSMYPIRPVVNILEQCAKQVDKNGKPKHQLFILSNLDPATFKYFRNTSYGKQVLKYFKPENIIISGDIGIIKPNPEIYKYFIKKFKLDPKECIFIDDELVNIKAAVESVKLTGILAKNSRQLRNDLKKLKVI